MAIEDINSLNNQKKIIKKEINKLENKLEDALEKQEKIKDYLIKLLIEILEEEKLSKHKKLFKKIKTLFIDGFKDWFKELNGKEDDGKKLINLVTEKDWKKIKDKFLDLKETLGDENGSEEGAFLYFIKKELDFEFVLKLKQDLKNNKKILETLLENTNLEVDKILENDND